MKVIKVNDDYDNKDRITKVVDENNYRNEVHIPHLHINHYKTDGDKTVGLNWSAYGTVTVEQAEEYIQLMKVAVAEAKKYNKKLLK